MFLSGSYNYITNADNFSKIPGSPVAYWWNNSILDCFKGNECKFGQPMKGIQTGKGEKFIRVWYEVSKAKIGFGLSKYDDIIISRKKWFPLTSGGQKRRWYGNFENVVNLENNGAAIRNLPKNNFRLKNPDYYFCEGLTWTEVTTLSFSCRYLPKDILFGNGGPVSFFNDDLFYLIGLLNSKVVTEFFSVLAPTMNYGPDQVRNIPYIYTNQEEVANLVEENISLSKADWDSFETSWDFLKHPFMKYIPASVEERKVATQDSEYLQSPVQYSFTEWMLESEDRFNKLKSNEEELNRIFIDIYGLQDELTPEVEDKDVTVRKADLTREIKSLISYAVGCMFGRYSLDVDGLAYAGGEWDSTKYKTFEADKDAIIPVCDDEYFDDDIVGRFVEFIKVVYGEDTLEENLGFIASALGGKGTPRQVIRNYFIKDFYKDHCNIYQKRPIYWLFDSGKNNGFKCLIYLHRYKPDTIARIRTDYVHEQQSRYRTAIDDLENRKEKASASDKVRLSKQLSALRDQAEELRQYEEKIHHLADQMISIDLDDGVKKNYELFSDVLAKIK